MLPNATCNNATPLQLDLIAMNSAIACCASAGAPAEALRLIRSSIPQAGLKADTTSYSGGIHAFNKVGDADGALEVFDEMRRAGVQADAVVYATLISALRRGGRPHEALRLFESMPGEGIEPDEVCFGAAMSACNHVGSAAYSQRALQVFDSMDALGVEPSKICYNEALQACCRAGEWSPEFEGKPLSEHCLGLVERMGIERLDASSYNQVLEVFHGTAVGAKLLEAALASGKYQALTRSSAQLLAAKGGPPTLDLHGLSAGAAQQAVLWWLEKLTAGLLSRTAPTQPHGTGYGVRGDAAKQPDGEVIRIIVGKGSHHARPWRRSAREPELSVRGSIQAMLEDANAPIVPSSNGGAVDIRADWRLEGGFRQWATRFLQYRQREFQQPPTISWDISTRPPPSPSSGNAVATPTTIADRTADAADTTADGADALKVPPSLKSSPSKSSPSKSSPAKSNPAKSSPAKSSPAKSSPAKSSPAKSNPAKSSHGGLPYAEWAPRLLLSEQLRGEGYIFATLPMEEFVTGGSLASGSFAKHGTLCPLPPSPSAPSSAHLGASRRISALSSPSSAYRSRSAVPGAHKAVAAHARGLHAHPHVHPHAHPRVHPHAHSHAHPHAHEVARGGTRKPTHEPTHAPPMVPGVITQHQPPMVPGVVIFSRRAASVAAWLGGHDLSALMASLDAAELRLHTGSGSPSSKQELVLASLRQSELVAQARTFEQSKRSAGGLHFLAIQSGPGAEEPDGLWLLREEVDEADEAAPPHLYRTPPLALPVEYTE